MKNYMPGFIISLIFFIILAIVDSHVYSNVMSLNVLVHLLVLHVIFYKHLVTDKKRLPYLIFIFIFIISVFFSLPKLTHAQAKEKGLDNHKINIVETSTILLVDDWNPFASDGAYFFKGYNSKSEEISIIVIPNTGEVIVKNQ